MVASEPPVQTLGDSSKINSRIMGTLARANSVDFIAQDATIMKIQQKFGKPNIHPRKLFSHVNESKGNKEAKPMPSLY